MIRELMNSYHKKIDNNTFSIKLKLISKERKIEQQD